MKRLLLVLMVAFCGLIVNAQLLSWTPPFPTENNSSQTLVITVDASKGNKGLLNYSNTNDVYVHIGVTTNKSGGQWVYVPFSWGTTPSAAHATYAGSNKWQYTITGSLRNFFNITDTSEHIQKIAILFRNGSGSQKQANSDNSDMFIPVYTSSLAVRIDQPASQPKYAPVPEPQGWIVGTTFTVTANASQSSTITLFHNGNQIGTATNSTSLTDTSTVTTEGNQQIVAEADNGTIQTFDTMNIFVSPSSSPAADLPSGVRDGINYQAGDTTVVLVLRAPGKTKASVIGDFNAWTQDVNYIMNRTTDGKFFWIKLHHLTPGTEYAYQYVVDDTLRIADPYTEKVLDPDNDPGIPATTYPGLKAYPSGKTSGIVSVLQTHAPAYSWGTSTYSRPDKRGLVIYELLVRDFVANHDWKTIRDSLNYFRTLGINAIEVMPFNEFEGNNSWGYNPDFYFAPDKYYGPANTLKEFIDSCHRSGIAVIMDIALNHSFGSSPMVQLYFDNQNSRPAANNPWFNPVPKHAFNVGYDMNHESPDTKYFVSRVMEHWTQQYNIDGFRFDLAKGFTQKQTCDATGNNCDVNAWNAYDSSRVKIWKGYYDSLESKSAGAYAILEYFADNTEEKELADYGMMLWGNMNANYAQAAMGYAGPDPGGNQPDFTWGIYTSRGWSKPHLVTYMESHDEERIMYKNEQYGNASGSYNIKDTATGLKRIELDGAFFFTLPGPKMIWEFEELGYDYPINWCTDGTVNNNCRLTPKPIRWDYLKDARRKEVHDIFSSLIKLRFHPWYKDAFIAGNISSSLAATFKWLKVSSASDTSDLLVVGNFDVQAQSASITFQKAGTWYDYLANTPYTATGSAQNISLQPGEFHVFVNRNVSSTSATPVVDVPWNGNTLEVKVYPNPVLSPAVIEIKMPQRSNCTADLYNSVGEHVSTVYNSFLEKGANRISLKKIHVPAGAYFLKVTTKAANKTVQLIIE